MEVFIQDNSEIQRITDDVIARLQAAYQSTGKEAAGEFYQGIELIKEIAGILQNITNLSESELLNGLHQLIEQRLPGQMMIDDFAEFSQLLDDMLKAGLAQMLSVPTATPQNQPSIKSISSTPLNTILPSSRIALDAGRILQLNSFKSFENKALNLPLYEYENPINRVHMACDVVESPSLSEPLKIALNPNLVGEEEPLALPAMSTANLSVQKNEQWPSSSVERFVSQLSEVFPKADIEREVCFAGYSFLAKVDSLLIHLLPEGFTDSASYMESIRKKVKEQGMSIVFFEISDLAFPRRMLREIRNIKPRKKL